MRIVLKESSTQRLAGRKRKIVLNKTEIMYIPILKTLQSQLNNSTILMEVSLEWKADLHNVLIIFVLQCGIK